MNDKSYKGKSWKDSISYKGPNQKITIDDVIEECIQNRKNKDKSIEK